MKVLTLAWVVEALRDKSLLLIDSDELTLRNALRDFFAGETAIVQQAENILELTRRMKRLEQFHCEHEFSDPKKGCLESIFCSKCGALHPDWERCGGGMALPYPNDAVWIGDSFYAPKRKEAP